MSQALPRECGLTADESKLSSEMTCCGNSNESEGRAIGVSRPLTYLLNP